MGNNGMIRRMNQRLQASIRRLPKYAPVIAVVAVSGVVGTVLLTTSHAATPVANVQAGTGTVSANASVVSDSTASGGSAVKFGTGSSGGGGGSTTCNLNATTSNFAAQVAAATAGQTVCLANGNYGEFAGVNKVVTIAAAPGASPTMSISFGSGDAGFTLDGMGGMSGDFEAGAKNITIRNSAFTSPVTLDNLVNSNVLFDHDTFNNQSTSDCKGVPARVWIEDSTSPTGITVSNSTLSGGNLDGIRPDASGGATIIGNSFINVEESGPNDCQHTDSIQMYGGENNVIENNYFVGGSDGIVAFDGTSNNTITGNACGSLGRGACISLYSDKNSVIQHNTTIGSMTLLEIDHKTADPAGSGTIYKDNIGTLEADDGSTVAQNTNNLFSGAGSPNISGSPTFVGGSSPTTWAGFKLATGSAGIGRASDGTNIGIN